MKSPDFFSGLRGITSQKKAHAAAGLNWRRSLKETLKKERQGKKRRRIRAADDFLTCLTENIIYSVRQVCFLTEMF